MKKVVKAVLFLIILIISGILVFEHSYKLTSDDFITEKTTFIYSNKNINQEKLKKLEKIFNVDNVAQKEILKKVKSISFLSQSKVYSNNINIVAIADTGIYYPIIYMNLYKYFDEKENFFYELKDEYKTELGLSNIDKVYLKAYRGLFFIGIDTITIDKVINSKDKRSIKVVEILEKQKDNGLGTFILNQERERLFGIDRVVVSGDIKDNKIIFDSFIYGDNEIIKDLSVQPNERLMPKFISDNKLYISTTNINKLDTFILRAISYKMNINKKTNLIQELFIRGFVDIISELNGEIIIDTKNGNYLLGLKSSKNIEFFTEYFENNENINIEKDIVGNAYICIGNNTFVLTEENKIIENNQFLSGIIDIDYGKVEINGFYDFDKLRIKTQINTDK